MSILLMSKVFTTNLQPSKKIVLLALADFASDAGTNIFPSISTIAIKSSLSHRSVQMIISSFLDTGILRTTKNPKGGAPGSTRHLVIDLVVLDNLVKLSRDEKSAPVKQRGEKKRSEGVQTGVETSEASAPKPSKNRHKNTTTDDHSSSTSRSGEVDEFEWPPQLDFEEREAIQSVLASISNSFEQKQYSLDELRAALARREIPRKAAWVRSVNEKGIERTPAGRAYDRARSERRERNKNQDSKPSARKTEVEKEEGLEKFRQIKEGLKK